MKIKITNTVLEALTNEKVNEEERRERILAGDKNPPAQKKLSAAEKDALIREMLGEDYTEEMLYRYIGVNKEAGFSDVRGVFLSNVSSQLFSGASTNGNTMEVHAEPVEKKLFFLKRWIRVVFKNAWQAEADSIEKFNRNYSALLTGATRIVTNQEIPVMGLKKEEIKPLKEVKPEEEKSSVSEISESLSESNNQKSLVDSKDKESHVSEKSPEVKTEPKEDYLKDISVDDIDDDFSPEKLDALKENEPSVAKDIKNPEEKKETSPVSLKEEENKKSPDSSIDDDFSPDKMKELEKNSWGLKDSSQKEEAPKKETAPVSEKQEEKKEAPAKSFNEGLDDSEMEEDFKKLSGVKPVSDRETIVPKMKDAKEDAEILTAESLIPPKAEVFTIESGETETLPEKPVYDNMNQAAEMEKKLDQSIDSEEDKKSVMTEDSMSSIKDNNIIVHNFKTFEKEQEEDIPSVKKDIDLNGSSLSFSPAKEEKETTEKMPEDNATVILEDNEIKITLKEKNQEKEKEDSDGFESFFFGDNHINMDHSLDEDEKGKDKSPVIHEPLKTEKKVNPETKPATIHMPEENPKYTEEDKKHAAEFDMNIDEYMAQKTLMLKREDEERLTKELLARENIQGTSKSQEEPDWKDLGFATYEEYKQAIELQKEADNNSPATSETFKKYEIDPNFTCDYLNHFSIGDLEATALVMQRAGYELELNDSIGRSSKAELMNAIDKGIGSNQIIRAKINAFNYPRFDANDKNTTIFAYADAMMKRTTGLKLNEDNAELITLASFNMKELKDTLDFASKNPSLKYLLKPLQYKIDALSDTRNVRLQIGGFEYGVSANQKFIYQNVTGTYGHLLPAIINNISSNKVMDKKFKLPSQSNTVLKPKIDDKKKFFIDLGPALQQNTGNGCWSCSLHELLLAQNVKMSQEEIRAYRPSCDNQNVKNHNSLTQLKDRIAFAGRSELDVMNTLFDYTELIHKAVPSAVVHQVQLAGNDPGKTIKEILTKYKTPVSITNGGHYTTIVGFDGDKYLYLDSTCANPETIQGHMREYPNCCVGNLKDIHPGHEIVWIENSPNMKKYQDFAVKNTPAIGTGSVELTQTDAKSTQTETISVPEDMAKNLHLGQYARQQMKMDIGDFEIIEHESVPDNNPKPRIPEQDMSIHK